MRSESPPRLSWRMLHSLPLLQRRNSLPGLSRCISKVDEMTDGAKSFTILILTIVLERTENGEQRFLIHISCVIISIVMKLHTDPNMTLVLFTRVADVVTCRLKPTGWLRRRRNVACAPGSGPCCTELGAAKPGTSQQFHLHGLTMHLHKNPPTGSA